MALHKQFTTTLSALTLATLSACGGGSGGGSGDNGGGNQAIDTSPKFQIFTGFDGASGSVNSSDDVAIYKTNGTQSGTVALKQDVSIYGGTSALIHFDNGNKVIFKGQTKNSGIEPWVTDGTPNGTRLLKDIAPNANSSLSKKQTGKFGEYKGKIYFSATTTGNNYSFYQTDGTPNNTKALFSYAGKKLTHQGVDYRLSEGGSHPIINTEGIYFILTEDKKTSPRRPGAEKMALARYNLNSQAFELVTEIQNGQNVEMLPINGHVYTLKGGELGVLGKLSGTSIVSLPQKIRPLRLSYAGNMNSENAKPQQNLNMSTDNGKPMYFLGIDKTNDQSPKGILIAFKKDGTLSTIPVKAPSWLPDVNAQQFMGNIIDNYGSAVQLKDGLYTTYSAGNKTLKHVKINFDGSSEEIKNVGQATGGWQQRPSDAILAVFNDFALTKAKSKENTNTCTGQELWKLGNNQYDLLKNINPSKNPTCHARGSNPEVIGKVGTNKLIFTANDNSKGTEAWVTDGTAKGTQLLKDINPGKKTGAYSKVNDLNSKNY